MRGWGAERKYVWFLEASDQGELDECCIDKMLRIAPAGGTLPLSPTHCTFISSSYQSVGHIRAASKNIQLSLCHVVCI